MFNSINIIPYLVFCWLNFTKQSVIVFTKIRIIIAF